MKLYYSKGACSLAVRINLHEMDIPCEFESVDLKTKKTETGADFLSINPKGMVPTLVLDSKAILTENAVINQYLSDTHQSKGFLPPFGDDKRYHALEWLNFITTDIHKGFGPLFNSKVPDELKDTVFKVGLKGKFGIIEHHLSQNKYMFGDQYTVSDGYLFVMGLWAKKFKIALTDLPALTKYFENLKKRPAIQKALQEEGLS